VVLPPRRRTTLRNSGQASGRGPSGARSGLLWAAAAIAAIVLAGCGGSGSGSGSGAPASAQYPSALPGKTTGTYPAFLPKKTLQPDVDAALIGTEARPALQVEGLPIEVRTKAFDVRVTVSGPIVPGEGLPEQPAATTCTWTVTMTDATADVPIRVADFHSVDHLGSVFLMGLVPGAHAPPAVLHRGQRVTFQLRAYELTGEGMMQWAPDHTHVVGDWDYTVEND
jgi:hypothetical protein